jgi:NAD(P)H-hydrate epimerase
VKGPAEHLPRPIYSAAQVRELDRLAIERVGLPGYELMSRAGAAALQLLRQRWPQARSLLIVCGAGNNAGDGLVVARLAHAAGLAVRVLLLVPSDKLKGDAARAADDCSAAGVVCEPFAPGALARGAADVIVDAVLGTGADRLVGGSFLAAIEAMNSANLPVLALDIPSGLDADTGWPRGAAVRATVTITFVGLKQGLFLGAGVDFTGELAFADLGIPPVLAAGLAPRLERLGPSDLDRALPPRPRSAHKGSSGRLLLLGGGPGMAGAIRLAAEAALRVGAGLVYVATHRDNVGAVLAGRPEIICRAVATAADLDDLIGLADGAVLGPGLGLRTGQAALAPPIGSPLPLVADADALNLLATTPVARSHWLVTPHPGKATRLLSLADTHAVQRDRYAAVRELAAVTRRSRCLRAPSLIAAPNTDEPLWVCDRGTRHGHRGYG